MGITQGRSMAGKVAVMGLLERHGKDGVKPDSSGAGSEQETASPDGTHQGERRSGFDHAHRLAAVLRGARIATTSTRSLTTPERYVDGKVHTNSVENFWSLLKRTIKGTYVSVEPFHLFRYLDEQAFRFNNRKTNDAERFVMALKGIINKRVTYSALTGSELPQTC